VITLERRLSRILDESSFSPSEREFTSVLVHRDWKNSLLVDFEAVKLLREGGAKIATEMGFRKDWLRACTERAEYLKEQGFNHSNADWKEKLCDIRFKSIDRLAVKWEPAQELNQTVAQNGVANAIDNRLVIGEVIAVSDDQMLIRDVRDDQSRIVSLKDVGLSYPYGIVKLIDG